MTLSDLSIKNAVFAVMLSTAMIVFGYLGYRNLGISQFPEIDFPVVNITTYWEGAPPEIVDAEITDVIEDVISGVEGIDYMSSQSTQGTSVVTVFFHLHRDIDAAMVDVKNAVTAAANRLPKDKGLDPSVVSKVNFNKFPVMWLAVHGTKPMNELSAFVDDHLKQRVQTIPGVGGIMYGGLRPRNMRIWLDKDRLQAYGLDALDVMRALRLQHVEMPAGYIKGDSREFNVRVMGEAGTPEEFAYIPVAIHGQQIVRVGDVAVVEDGLADRRGFARFNRQPNIGIGVMRATGANVVQVCTEVKSRMKELQATCPPGVEISISTDYSTFIIDDIDEVKQSLIIGVILTAVVSYLFLGSIGTTLNVCISIPTSLMGTFIAVSIFGFTINFMTLLALSLSVGVVVDDAILVLENIYRRRELGEDRMTAALKGAREISFAAIAATLSIAAIFIPVAFLKGSIGLYFFQFGITCTVAVMLSLVVSLTITPMLCSRFLNVRPLGRPMPPRFAGLFGGSLTLVRRAYWLVDRWFLEVVFIRPMNWLMDQLTRQYGRALRLTMRHRWWVVPPSILLAASALVFALGIDIPLPQVVGDSVGIKRLQIKPVGQELVPSEDQNRCLVNVICPVGSGLDYVDDMLKKGEDMLADMTDPVTGNEVIATFYSAVAIRPGQLISEGILFVRLHPAHERTMTQTDIINRIRAEYAKIPGVRAIALDLSTQGFTAVRGYPVDFAVQGPEWDKVTAYAQEVQKAMAAERVAGPDGSVPLVADVNSDYRPGMPEVHLIPDTEKAAELGVSIQRVASTVSALFSGPRIGRFTHHDKRYDVRVRLLTSQRQTSSQIDDLPVKSENGKLVPLRDLTKRRTVSTLPVLNRYNHQLKVQITANIGPGSSQGEAVARCRQIAEEVREAMNLPTSYRIVQLGNAQAMQETLDSLWWALFLGFVVATMILGVQFNSFVHPFTVLIAVPFGVTGALATLWVCGDRLNIMSMIGMVLLAGLVKKNSIILVDYTNQLRKEGLGLKEAVLTACPIRLRPILMTSLATIAAAIPLAIGFGPGAETRAPLARSIIGGIMLSTLVTLIIVPVFYVLFDQFGSWFGRIARRPEEKTLILTKTMEKALSLNGTNGQVAAKGETAVAAPS